MSNLSPLERSHILNEATNTLHKTSNVTWPWGSQFNLKTRLAQYLITHPHDVLIYNNNNQCESKLNSTFAYLATVVRSFRTNLSQARAAFIRAMVRIKI